MPPVLLKLELCSPGGQGGEQPAGHTRVSGQDPLLVEVRTGSHRLSCVRGR